MAGKIADNLNYAVESSRKLARGIYPIAIGENTLQVALRKLAEETSENYGIFCNLIVNGDIIINDIKVETNLFYIAREAVVNAVRHGKASEVELKIEHYGGAVRLTVADNGSGFPAGWERDKDKSSGLGLNIMKYRADMIGGFFKIESGKNGGVNVVCAVKK